MGGRNRWRGMASKVGWHHHKEKCCSHWYNSEKVGVQADEGAYSEEGKGVCGCTPCKETLEPVLENKDYSNPVAVLAI